jgi:hypothetical protein
LITIRERIKKYIYEITTNQLNGIKNTFKKFIFFVNIFEKQGESKISYDTNKNLCHYFLED